MKTNPAVKRSRAAVVMLVLVLAVIGLVTHGGVPPLSAQAAWPFHLEWDCDTARDTVFQLCVDGACERLNPSPIGPSAWRAPLPLLTVGEHRLVVKACRNDQCLEGLPDLVVRVTPGGGRRPPIDVVTGPRIPVPPR